MTTVAPQRCESCGKRAMLPTGRTRADGGVLWKCLGKGCTWTRWGLASTPPPPPPKQPEPVRPLKVVKVVAPAVPKLPPICSPWPRQVKPARIEAVIQAACDILSVTTVQLFSNRRHKSIVLARAVIVCVARRRTCLSFPEIAQAMGRPSHSTVVTAHQRAKTQLDKSVRELVGEDINLPKRIAPLTLAGLVAMVEAAA